MEHISLDVFDYNRKKLCSQYDSSQIADGQAHTITLNENISGTKTLSFEMPFVIKKRKNFRWEMIKPEYLVRLRIGSYTDWYVIQNPKKSKSNKSISNKVSCNHISSILKTKNLYLVFDDENGIGTLPYLMEQILKGTGWTLGHCDKLLEKDGETEKARSLKSGGKDGSYKLITDVCVLFDAYPVFDGDAKKVNIYALENKRPLFEMMIGKDIQTLSADYNSDSIVTRLYVEGEYEDNGYMGIDDAEGNEYGLSYLMNFDYYRDIGAFTEEHEAALKKYYSDIVVATNEVKTLSSTLTQKENEINAMWGQIDYILYRVENRTLTDQVIHGTVKDEDIAIVEGDELVIIPEIDGYREVTAVVDGQYDLNDADVYLIKFITWPAGNIGAKQVAIEAKEKLIANWQEQLAETTDEKRVYIQGMINDLEDEIREIKMGSEETEGLNAMMHKVADLRYEIRDLTFQRENASINQDSVEVEFAVAIGDMLKEGYWNCKDYALGQEDLLYADALDMMAEISKPTVKYTVSRISLSEQFGYHSTDLEINSKVRIYDPDLPLNDIVYVSAVTWYLDKPQDDKVTLTNDSMKISGLSLDSILSRITKLADLIDQKNSLYERSEAIGSNGSIYVDRLEGQINVLKNHLSSVVSSWYTDDSGNIIFENTTGKSAMMLCGDGFMIANGKNDSGDWNWRTFGTGQGFTADAITTGYLSAQRIEAGSITASHLSANAGDDLLLDSNESVQLVAQNAVKNYDYAGDDPPDDPVNGMLWIDTSTTPPVLKRYDEEAWLAVSSDKEEFQQEISNVTAMINANTNKISQVVSRQEQIGNEINSVRSSITQTESDWEIEFQKVNKRIEDDTANLRKYEQEVSTYIRFNEEGMELGKSDSEIKAELTNSKMSFIHDDVDVAYISDHKLYVPEANILDRISIGNMNNGYFDLITTPTGLAIKWRTTTSASKRISLMEV